MEAWNLAQEIQEGGNDTESMVWRIRGPREEDSILGRSNSMCKGPVVCGLQHNQGPEGWPVWLMVRSEG